MEAFIAHANQKVAEKIAVRWQSAGRSHLRMGALVEASVALEGLSSKILEYNPPSMNTFQTNDLLGLMGSAANHPELTYPVTFLVTFIAVVFLGVGQDDDNVGSPYPPGSTTYNKRIADQFFGARPLYVFRRLLKLSQITGAFNVKLLLDWRLGNLEDNEKERAKEALGLATQMGPTFIKLGQALSLRTDLIPEAYALELRQLQDAVPPFDSDEAFKIISRELGIPNLSSSGGGPFLRISSQPVASASIGQVYKATLRDGREVAIKVQRPNILREISLDLYLLRLLTPIQVRISNAVNKLKTNQGDIDVSLALVDEWGRGFVNEVDYLAEARNTELFLQGMRDRGLSAVTAPSVVRDLSTSCVLVTEWVEGTRLDLDASQDVPRLCGVAVNAYLTMLLDTGVLHCDPHPGNLLRTTDGKLCILDWGMTLDVPSDLQYALLEFIAHINTEDFDNLPQDFVNLGFSPPGKEAQLRSSGMTESLAFTFRQLQGGGGAKKLRERLGNEFRQRYGEDKTDDEIRKLAREEMIERMEERLQAEGVDVSGVTNVMEEMSRRNRELFKLPPYVLYVSRAFSTLEGIGLAINEDYSILAECYPYLARRLMSDNSPRAQRAFRTMIFGAGGAKTSEDTSQLLANAMGGAAERTGGTSSGGGAKEGFSAGKVLEMANNFQSYTASTTSVAADDGAKEAQRALADLIFSEEQNHVQNILLEGLARAGDSAMREAYFQLKQSAAGQVAKTALKTPKSALESIVGKDPKGLLRTVVNVATLPYGVAKAADTLLEKDTSDQSSIDSFNTLISAATTASTAGGSDDSEGLPTVQAPPLSDVTKVVTDQLRDPESVLRSSASPAVITSLACRFGGSLLLRAADRLQETHQELTETGRVEGSMSGLPLEADEISAVVADVASTSARSLASQIAPEVVPVEAD